jgi:hypothetical protein
MQAFEKIPLRRVAALAAKDFRADFRETLSKGKLRWGCKKKKRGKSYYFFLSGTEPGSASSRSGLPYH